MNERLDREGNSKRDNKHRTTIQTPDSKSCSAFFRAPIQNSPPKNLIEVKLIKQNLIAILFLICCNCQPVIGQEEFAQQEIGDWIKQLSSNRPIIREAAKANLKRAGNAAFDQIYRNRNSGTLEARLLKKELLSQIKFSWVAANDSPRVISLMDRFGQRNFTQQSAILDQLELLPLKESQSALLKIMQFETDGTIKNKAAGVYLALVFVRDRMTRKAAVSFAAKHLRVLTNQPVDSILGLENTAMRTVAAVFYLVKNLDRFETELSKNGRLQSEQEHNLLITTFKKIPSGNQIPLLRVCYVIAHDSRSILDLLDQNCLEIAHQAGAEAINGVISDLFFSKRYKTICKIFDANPQVIQTNWQATFYTAEAFYLIGKIAKSKQLADWALGKSSPFEEEKAKDSTLIAMNFSMLGLPRWGVFVMLNAPRTASHQSELWLISLEIQIAEYESALRRLQAMLKVPTFNVLYGERTYLLLAEIANTQQQNRR